MKKILSWLKEHVRPYIRMNRKDDKKEPTKEEHGFKDKIKNGIEDIEKNAEVGIKITWKF